ncbi:hypothetical protein A6A06_34730 [Streptomyces sp. CB02923]|uniref:hypothetical protein n=1 Tax=Streptomyces sp. CB02923 TaxID=1718985 RepID=UPI00093AFBFD|nr:hypothetical protein [Streptomyces sp. CB02923]OKI08019.1 hypothetical protein A6A06_34730 [Streptomyces sp. CB02923]
MQIRPAFVAVVALAGAAMASPTAMAASAAGPKPGSEGLSVSAFEDPIDEHDVRAVARVLERVTNPFGG